MANQIINSINLEDAKVKVEKLKPEDKELLKSCLLTEENKSILVDNTGQYDSLISLLELESIKDTKQIIETKGPKKSKKPSKKSGKKKK